jgi:hypothetical protein
VVAERWLSVTCKWNLLTFKQHSVASCYLSNPWPGLLRLPVYAPTGQPAGPRGGWWLGWLGSPATKKLASPATGLRTGWGGGLRAGKHRGHQQPADSSQIMSAQRVARLAKNRFEPF